MQISINKQSVANIIDATMKTKFGDRTEPVRRRSYGSLKKIHNKFAVKFFIQTTDANDPRRGVCEGFEDLFGRTNTRIWDALKEAFSEAKVIKTGGSAGCSQNFELHFNIG